MGKSWRDHCAPIIAEVIQKYRSDPEELRRQLRAAYPFGERKRHPYKIWCDEIRRQLKTPKRKPEPLPQEQLF